MMDLKTKKKNKMTKKTQLCQAGLGLKSQMRELKGDQCA